MAYNVPADCHDYIWKHRCCDLAVAHSWCSCGREICDIQLEDTVMRRSPLTEDFYHFCFKHKLPVNKVSHLADWVHVTKLSYLLPNASWWLGRQRSPQTQIANCFGLIFQGLISLKTGLIEAAKDMDESQPLWLSECPIKSHFRDNILFCSKITLKFYNRKIVSNWFFPLFQSFCGKKIALLAGTMFPDIENEAEVL